ncbi:uncharacterized protein LOC129601439 isoform X2 [Paramacrobiotus metropolitanus]|uniref:uncharacterized protein LOC129601439 isoform X2 n=1 Tax=Paramacrobiotus metropolitanus TaxID=2943436 RepID=UPI0024459D13|nr:uncharacterized protein LOC129601439 isoform X2 [Paramacrobiotus metropolitanus]
MVTQFVVTRMSVALLYFFLAISVWAQFEHQHSDRFHEILTRFRSITGLNCASRPRHELFMPREVISHLPNIKDLYINPLFPNRTNLVHVHNMALNRAFFYSFLFRYADDPDEPGLMYFYVSHLADVAANRAINASAVYFDVNCSYPNWYRDYFNKTFPLFAPRAVRGDNFNDPINPHRYSTLLMTNVEDLGVVTNSPANYTHTLYRTNDWYTSWLPDAAAADYAKVTYTVNIKFANGTEQNIEFFGPPEPQADPGPVKWTAPYFDCGRTNKWLIAAVSPVLDLHPRHTSWRHLQRHKYVGAVVIETDLLKIDMNPCPVSEGNPLPNWYAGTDRCRKRTTECEPLQGYGLKRGGYACRCRPGYRLPFWQIGPFQGEIIERAIEVDYLAKFECEKIGNIRVVTEHATSSDIYLHRRPSGYLGPLGGERPYSYLFGLDPLSSPEGYRWPLYPFTSNRSQFYDAFGQPLGPDGRRIVYGPDGLPVVTLAGTTAVPFDYLPTWQAFNTHVYHGIMNFAGFPMSPINLSIVDPIIHRNVRSATPSFCPQSPNPAQCGVPLLLPLRLPNMLVRHSHIISNRVLLNTLRAMRLINPENCRHFRPEHLKLQGNVAYGKENQLENQARTALRLAHFISVYNQIVDPRELFFERTADLPLNEHQLFSEVLANVMGDMRILSSGIYYENSKFPGRVHFGPTAERTSRNARAFFAADQAALHANKDRFYLNQEWFKAVKERWKASPASQLTKFATRMRIRGDRTGKYSIKYDRYPEQYLAPILGDGHWSAPYYSCHGHIKEWVITYVVPFFGLDGIRDAVEFQFRCRCGYDAVIGNRLKPMRRSVEYPKRF